MAYPARGVVMGAGRARIAIACVLLAAATALCYVGALGAGFVFDDTQYIQENPRVLGGLTWEGARWALTGVHAANWHPLTWISHMADVSMFGVRPAGHHAVSILFHAVNAALLLLLLVRLTGSFAPSLLAAGLFALHPLRVESVAWIAERKDVLSTFFALLALLAYERWSRSPGMARRMLVLAAFVAALMSKAMPITLPLLLLLLDYWPLGRLSRASLGRRIVEKWPLLLASAGSAAVTVWAQASWGALRSTETHPLALRVANAALSYGRYIVKAVWPAGLSVHYPYPGAEGIAVAAAVSGVTIAAVTVLAVRQAGRRPWLTVGWLWYLVSLVPVIGVVQVGTQAMADRYTYVPLIGISIVAAWAWEEAARRLRLPVAARLAIPILVVAGLAVATVAQVGHWKDQRTLFSHALAVDPGNALALNQIGILEYADGRYDRAEAAFREGLRADPNSPLIHANLASLLLQAGRPAEAVEHCRAALRFNPRDYRALNNLGFALAASGRRAEAMAEFQEALKIAPGSAATLLNVGILLAEEGRHAEAIEWYSRSIRFDPASAEAHLRMAVSWERLGRSSEAVAAYSEALRLNPGLPPARAALSRLTGR